MNNLLQTLAAGGSQIRKQEALLKSKDGTIDDLKDKLSKAEARFLLQADIIKGVHERVEKAEGGIRKRLDILSKIKSYLWVGDFETGHGGDSQADAATQTNIETRTDAEMPADVTTRIDVATQSTAPQTEIVGLSSIAGCLSAQAQSTLRSKTGDGPYALVLIDVHCMPVCLECSPVLYQVAQC